MKTKFLDKTFTYDGSQLRSLFNYLDHGLLGDSIVGWIGPCKIPKENIVDVEDLRADQKICGGQMVHFIAEIFDQNLFSGVLLQRLMASIVKDELSDFKLIRKGDDLFFAGRKLSISVATQSPGSTLVHFAINVTNEGTPVDTSCLKELNQDPIMFSKSILEKVAMELINVKEATCKVKWVC
jgi:uncharacterized protein